MKCHTNVDGLILSQSAKFDVTRIGRDVAIARRRGVPVKATVFNCPGLEMATGKEQESREILTTQ